MTGISSKIETGGLAQLGRVVDVEGQGFEPGAVLAVQVLFFLGQWALYAEQVVVLEDGGGGATVAGAERRAKIIAVLVRGATVPVGFEADHLLRPGWLSMPMLAVVAREADEGEQVQAEYAEKLLHAAKVTGKAGKSCSVRLDGCKKQGSRAFAKQPNFPLFDMGISFYNLYRSNPATAAW